MFERAVLLLSLAAAGVGVVAVVFRPVIVAMAIGNVLELAADWPKTSIFLIGAATLYLIGGLSAPMFRREETNFLANRLQESSQKKVKSL